eukprot:472532-Prymnesium_polylepis.2
MELHGQVVVAKIETDILSAHKPAWAWGHVLPRKSKPCAKFGQSNGSVPMLRKSCVLERVSRTVRIWSDHPLGGSPLHPPNDQRWISCQADNCGRLQ